MVGADGGRGLPLPGQRLLEDSLPKPFATSIMPIEDLPSSRRRLNEALERLEAAHQDVIAIDAQATTEAQALDRVLNQHAASIEAEERALRSRSSSRGRREGDGSISQGRCGGAKQPRNADGTFGTCDGGLT